MPPAAFQAGGIKIKRSLWPTDPNILSWNVTGNPNFLPYHNNNNKLLAHRNITGSMQALICIEWLQVGGTLFANHGQVYMYL